MVERAPLSVSGATPPGTPQGTPTARLYPALPMLAVSIAVFRTGEALLATRVNEPYAGLYSLPGGLVEAGETLEEAALRELFEEVGVRARIVGFNRHVQSIERDADGRTKRHFVIASFVGDWVSGEGTPGPEAGKIVWTRPERLSGFACTPFTEEVLAQAAALWTAREGCGR